MSENIRPFRDVRIHQVAMGEGMDALRLSREFPAEKKYPLTDQMRRSPRPVCAALAEACRKRKYPAAFVAKLSDSEAEVNTQLERLAKPGFGSGCSPDCGMATSCIGYYNARPSSASAANPNVQTIRYQAQTAETIFVVVDSQLSASATTAIDYTNGAPHIGHAYEKVLADVLARYHRLKGDGVFFLTGVDQHGQKVQQSAEKQGVAPAEFVEELAGLDAAQTRKIMRENFAALVE